MKWGKLLGKFMVRGVFALGDGSGEWGDVGEPRCE